MKKSIVYLVLAQAISTAVAVANNAGLYTMLYMFAIQSTILLLILTFYALPRQSAPHKFMTLVQAGIFSIFMAIMFFFLVKFPGQTITMSDGTKNTVDLGKLSIFPLVVGGLSFLVGYFLDARRNVAKQFKNEISQTTSNYVVLFGHTVVLILMFYIAITFADRGLSIVLIAVIKTVLDIGLIVLAGALSKIDLFLSSIMNMNKK